MKKSFLLILILSVLIFSANIELKAQYSGPESVIYDSLYKRYLVSNTSGQRIVQRDLSGNVTDFVIVGSSCHGLGILDSVVYVANGSRVRGYKLSDASLVMNLQLTGATFLNGMTIGDNGIIYVSDFTNRRIYKVDPESQTFWIYIANTTNTPNGLHFDAPRNRILVCCWGTNAPVRSINLADSSITTLVNTGYNNCDGITIDRADNVYISAWSIQSVIKYDINFSNAPSILISGLSNPADINVNFNADTLAIPNSGNNTVTFVFLDNPTSITGTPHQISDYKLSQNIPNPFNPETKILYSITVNTKVELRVFNILGEEVKTLVNEIKEPGEHTVRFNGGGLTTGIYYYKLTAGEFSEVRKMLLIK